MRKAFQANYSRQNTVVLHMFILSLVIFVTGMAWKAVPTLTHTKGRKCFTGRYPSILIWTLRGNKMCVQNIKSAALFTQPSKTEEAWY